MAGDEGRASRRRSKPASLSSARSAARLDAISAGCALAVSVSSASGPSNIRCDSFCAERRVDAREHLPRGGKRSASALPMPTVCDPCPGNTKAVCHDRVPPPPQRRLASRAIRKGAAQTRPRPRCQAPRPQTSGGVDQAALIAEAEAEGIGGVLHEPRFRADERASADARNDASVRAELEGRPEPAADKTFLNPDIAGPQLAVRMKARELGARSRSAGRSVIGAAGTEDEIAAVGVSRSRRERTSRCGRSPRRPCR